MGILKCSPSDSDVLPASQLLETHQLRFKRNFLLLKSILRKPQKIEKRITHNPNTPTYSCMVPSPIFSFMHFAFVFSFNLSTCDSHILHFYLTIQSQAFLLYCFHNGFLFLFLTFFLKRNGLCSLKKIQDNLNWYKKESANLMQFYYLEAITEHAYVFFQIFF